MLPPSLESSGGSPIKCHKEPPPEWVRGALLVLVLGLIAVFALARWLDPYEADGKPRQQGTHRQLGLPPCTFYRLTGMPCPSCGMTTSFAMFVRGDLANAFRANSVGMLLAIFGVGLIPWCLVALIRRRTFHMHALEKKVTYIALGFLLLMMLRWSLVLLLGWHI